MFNPLNAELNPICHLLALLGSHHILHVSGLKVKPCSSNRLRYHLDITLSVCSLYQCADAPLNISSFRCAIRQHLLDCFALNTKPVRSFKASDTVDPTSRRKITYFDFTITTVGKAGLSDFKQEQMV